MLQAYQSYYKDWYGIGFCAAAMTNYLLANKNDTLNGSFGFVGSKNGFTTGNQLKVKAFFRTYKSNENTTDLCVKFLKQLP